MVTQLFLTHSTGKGLVGTFCKALGVLMHGVFPLDKEQKRKTKEGPRVSIFNKHKGCKHHCIVPVVYAAAAAALVLHKPGLEWAEEQNADNITNGISKAYKEQYACIYNPCKIQHTDYTIKCKPRSRHGEGGFCRIELCSFALFEQAVVIACKLLLTAHTFVLRGKTAQNHLHKEHCPYTHKQNMIILPAAEGFACVMYAVKHIHHKSRYKKNRTVDKLYIVEDNNIRHFSLFITQGKTSSFLL